MQNLTLLHWDYKIYEKSTVKITYHSKPSDTFL